jgi:kumamolisin
MTMDALEPANPDERAEVSVMVRPRRPLSELEARLGQQPLSREEFAAEYGADPSDLKRIEDFARQHGLEVVEASQPRRTVRLAGRAADIGTAFGLELQRYRLKDGTEYRVPSGPVRLPPDLEGVVQDVFGLDTRPVARRLA